MNKLTILSLIFLCGCATNKLAGRIEFTETGAKCYTDRPMDMKIKKGDIEVEFSTKQSGLMRDILKLYTIKKIEED